MDLFEAKAPGIMAGLMIDLALPQLFHAGGILGNFGWECNGFQTLHQIGGNAVGWPQWDGERKIAFLQWCQRNKLGWTSDEANYHYFVGECLTSERAALDALKATTDLKSACDVFEAKDERAGVPALSGRESYARRAMAAYAAAPQPVKPIFSDPIPVAPKPVPVPIPPNPSAPDDPGVSDFDTLESYFVRVIKALIALFTWKGN